MTHLMVGSQATDGVRHRAGLSPGLRQACVLPLWCWEALVSLQERGDGEPTMLTCSRVLPSSVHRGISLYVCMPSAPPRSTHHNLLPT